MSRFGYSNEGNGLNGRGRIGFNFQSWVNTQGEASNYKVAPKRPDILGKLESTHSHECKPVIVDAEGRMIAGVPLSCPPNVKCKVLDYSDMQQPGGRSKAKGLTGNGGHRGGFPQGMFQRMRSVGWNTPTYDGRKYRRDWNEGDHSWSNPSQNGWKAPQHYASQGSLETGQAYPSRNGWQTVQGHAGAIDSREAAKRYNGRCTF